MRGLFGRNVEEQKRRRLAITAWLKEHRELWEGEKALNHIELSRAIREAGFYSAKTSLCDIRVNGLLKMIGA